MTLIFNKNSWHYHLILYIYGENFFLQTTGLDLRAMETQFKPEDFAIIYKTIPKTVNLCPYCRAVVGGIILFPFVWLKRRLPYTPKKLTHLEAIKKSKRNTMIIKIVVATGMGLFGIWKVIVGEYPMAAFYFGLVIFNLYSTQIMGWIMRHWPKRKIKTKPFKSKRKTPEIIKKIETKHDVICPPIFFIDLKEDIDYT